MVSRGDVLPAVGAGGLVLLMMKLGRYEAEMIGSQLLASLLLCSLTLRFEPPVYFVYLVYASSSLRGSK